MVGMGRSSGGDGPHQIAGLNRVNRGPTDAGLAIFCQPARPHTAQFTTHTVCPNRAGHHIIRPVKGGIKSQLISPD